MKTLTLDEKQKQADVMLHGVKKTYDEHCQKVIIWRKANGCTNHGKWGK